MPSPNIIIQQYPGSGLPINVVPIANGANYMVNSNFVARDNFQYTADIYIENTFVAKLRHNKNVKASNQGIFDVSRVVENYINTDTQFLNAAGTTYVNPGLVSNIDAAKKFSIKFGAEYDRTFTIKSASSLGGYLFMEFDKTTLLTIPTQNYVFLTSNNKGLPSVLYVAGYTNSGIYVNYPWNANLANLKATGIEGYNFYDNYGWTDPVTGIFMLGFVVKTSNYVAGSFNVGDTLYTIQNPGATYPGYDGESKCMGTENVVLAGQNYTLIKTNKRVIGSTPAQGGIIYSTDRFRFSNLATSSDSYGFDGGLDYLTFNSYTPNTYKMTTTNTTGKFLTNKPDRNVKLPPTNKSFTLSMLGSSIMGTGGYNQVQIVPFNSAGAAITTLVISVTNSYLRNELVISPQLMAGYSSAFNNALNNQTMVYYRVRMYNSGTQVSESFNVTIDYECSRYDNYTLKFKNRLGGWDYHNFRARADRKVVIEKSNIRKKLNNYKSSPNKFGYFVGDRGLSTFNVKAYDTYVVNSGYLTNNNAQWLEELFTSPEVYWMNDTLTQEIPITLTQTEAVMGSKKNVGLINYVVEFQASYNKTIQRA